MICDKQLEFFNNQAITSEEVTSPVIKVGKTGAAEEVVAVIEFNESVVADAENDCERAEYCGIGETLVAASVDDGEVKCDFISAAVGIFIVGVGRFIEDGFKFAENLRGAVFRQFADGNCFNGFAQLIPVEQVTEREIPDPIAAEWNVFDDSPADRHAQGFAHGAAADLEFLGKQSFFENHSGMDIARKQFGHQFSAGDKKLRFFFRKSIHDEPLV